MTNILFWFKLPLFLKEKLENPPMNPEVEKDDYQGKHEILEVDETVCMSIREELQHIICTLLLWVPHSYQKNWRLPMLFDLK